MIAQKNEFDAKTIVFFQGADSKKNRKSQF